MFHRAHSVAFLAIAALVFATPVVAAELKIGSASVEITPPEPVAVSGQFGLRIGKDIQTPLTANALAFEAYQEGQAVDSAIIVSCDVISIPNEVLAQVRQEITKRVPTIDTRKVILAGTHTHTAPELRLGVWILPKEGVMTVAKYRDYFAAQVGQAVAEAWKMRQPASISWGMGHAAVAHNRRATYADGSSQMYGPTNTPEFRGLENIEDRDVNTLFAWNEKGEVIAAVVNVSCPSQEVEARHAINADYWHPVRTSLRKRFGDQLVVLGLCGAAGDISPHLMYRKAADERMRNLRGLSRLDEIARRVVQAVDDTYDVVKNDRHSNAIFAHAVRDITLPKRLVTEEEYAATKKEVAKTAAAIKRDPNAAKNAYRRLKWYQATVDRYEAQKDTSQPEHEMELHVLRIGNVALCTNQFELFTEFGIRIKGRSKAEQTFVVQLAGPGTYLPTARAVQGGHYSAIVHSSVVGPDGGQALVDQTVALIDELWPVSK